MPDALFCDCAEMTVEFVDAEYRELVVEGAEVDTDVVIFETRLLVTVAKVLPNELPVWPTAPELTKLDDCDDTKPKDVEVDSGAPLSPVALCVVDPPVVVYCVDNTLEMVVILLRLVW